MSKDKDPRSPLQEIQPHKGAAMYVWRKRLVIGLLAAFGLTLGLLLTQDQNGEASVLQQHTMNWIILNYAGLVIWLLSG